MYSTEYVESERQEEMARFRSWRIEQLSIPPLGFILVNKFSATSISHATDPHFTTPAQADSKSPPVLIFYCFETQPQC